MQDIENSSKIKNLKALLLNYVSEIDGVLDENTALNIENQKLKSELISARRHLTELLEEKKDSWWQGDPDGFLNYKGYSVPVDLILMTGGGPSSFQAVSDFHIGNLQKWIGIESDHNVVEVGCGVGRDAVPLTDIIRLGSYIGIDIIGRSIEWCSKNITPRHENFKFCHFDVDDQIHNPSGKTKTVDIRIEAGNNKIDRIFLFSVFTHLFENDIRHYLLEFSRVLKAGGLVYATTFIYNDDILASARASNLTPFDLRFEHEISPGCRINDLDNPLGAVAFTPEVWHRMIEGTGLRLRGPMLKGSWSGFYDQADDGQDVAILEKI